MQSIRPYVEHAGGRSRFLCLALLLCCAVPAAADEADAFNFFVGSNVTRDDNVFRLSPDSNAEIIPGSRERADTITMTYAGGNFKKMLGRQRIWLDLNLNQSRYERFSFLNFDGHSNAAGWDWRLSEHLSGRVGKTSSLQMAGFADLRRTIQNLYTNESEYVSADLWLMSDWHLETEFKRYTVDYDAAANQVSNRIEDSRKFGVRYTPRSGSFLLLRTITTDGTLPNQQEVGLSLIDNSYEQSEFGADFGTTLTGNSQLRGTLARTQREHKTVSERDFSGLTGNLGWDWNLSGKSLLRAKVRREIGAYSDLTASYILTNGANLSWNYQASAKTAIVLSYDYSRRFFGGDPIRELAGVEDRVDRINSLSLNLTYQPITSVTLSLNLTRSERDSNAVGIPFVADTAMLGAQFAF